MGTPARVVRFKCVVTCDLTPTLRLNGGEIELIQDGKTWTGTKAVPVAELVDIHCKVCGVEDEDWTLAITTECDNGCDPDKIFVPPAGKIPSGGSFEFFASGRVPASPCSAGPKH